MGLHQVLPGDHPLALVGVLAAPAVLRENRRLGLLGLQEQRLDPVQGVHQQDPGAGADAADPDHLAGHLDQRELSEQVPPVGLQGAPVLAQHGAELLVDRIGRHIGEDVFDGHDHRRVADDPPPPVHHGGELAQRLGAVPGVGLGQQALGSLEPFRLDLGLELADGLLDVQVGIPDVQERLLGEGAHRRAVPLGCRQDDLAAGFGGEPVVPSRHGQAGGQPLDVPLERAGQGLVEIVDVEDQPPLRRGERPEIGQVRIPAQLHPKPRRGSCGQIRRHRQRGPPVEGERGYQHPPVPDRHQLRHPALCLLQQQPDRIPRLARRELGMGVQRSQRPGFLPPRSPVRAAQLLHRPGPRRMRARCPRTRFPSRDTISRHSHGHSLRARRRGTAGLQAPRNAPLCWYQMSTSTPGWHPPRKGEHGIQISPGVPVPRAWRRPSGRFTNPGARPTGRWRDCKYKRCNS